MTWWNFEWVFYTWIRNAGNGIRNPMGGTLLGPSLSKPYMFALKQTLIIWAGWPSYAKSTQWKIWQLSNWQSAGMIDTFWKECCISGLKEEIRNKSWCHTQLLGWRPLNELEKHRWWWMLKKKNPIYFPSFPPSGTDNKRFALSAPANPQVVPGRNLRMPTP